MLADLRVAEDDEAVVARAAPITARSATKHSVPKVSRSGSMCETVDTFRPRPDPGAEQAEEGEQVQRRIQRIGLPQAQRHQPIDEPLAQAEPRAQG